MSKIKWGPYLLPPESASEHFLFVGSTGSGKTVLIKMLMRSAFNEQFLKLGTRGVVYDSKQDILPFLNHIFTGIKIDNLDDRDKYPYFHDLIVNLHPFDANCYAWDIAKDVTTPISARQISSILIPEPAQSTGADQFFVESSRELLMGAMIALMHSGKSTTWTFRDLLQLTLNPNYLSQSLNTVGLYTTKRIRRMYLEESDHRTRANILATLSTKMGVYETIAACWENAKNKISIKDWIKSNRVLVLGNDEAARASIDPINRALFQRISEELLSLPEQGELDKLEGRFRTWIILDEFREAGKLEGLRRLLNKGRSKGACIVLGCQDVEGVRSVYGREEGNELLGQCSHTVVLNVINPETAEWAANMFGSEDKNIENDSITIGGRYSESSSNKLERKNLITTRELVTMPRISPKNGLSGYYKSHIIENSPFLREIDQIKRIAPWKHGDPSSFSWATISEHLEQSSRNWYHPIMDIKRNGINYNDLLYMAEWSDDEIKSLQLGLENVDSEKPARDDRPKSNTNRERHRIE